MAQQGQSGGPSSSSHQPLQQTSAPNGTAAPAKRRREESPGGHGSQPPRQSSAIHQGTLQLMALIQQEQTAVAAMYQEKIDLLGRKVKAAQEQVDYLAQVTASGSDLLTTRAEFQKRLDESEKRIQQQQKAYAALLDAVRRNGMEPVIHKDGSSQKLDLRFNPHTQQTISRFFQLPDPNSSPQNEGSSGLPPASPLPSNLGAITPLQFFSTLQGATEKPQSAAEQNEAPVDNQAVNVVTETNIPPESTDT
ncbi:hypothetical protein CVT24_010704 [Panaeolus cyanescens]|uniref:Uncharacterized protein n=1 Tax=Panaeolus cyanescens TaxID=181874 RepID=A0A409YVW0_9AGAR|nr:hypothetical protein CVT24_010704 [Panaeolus cyanescens]